MSGRSAENLERWFGNIRGIWLVAEHGAELKAPSASEWEPLRSQVPTEWKATVLPILEHFVDRTPGSFVEEKKFAVVWHYRMAEPEFGEWLPKELMFILGAVLGETGILAVPGEENVGGKTRLGNKGEG